MDRRAFVTGVVAMLAAPLASDAQQPRKPSRVGFLTGSAVPDFLEALRQGLRERGWIEAQNYTLEYRSADGQFDRVPELAADLVRQNADVIVAVATAMGYIGAATGNVPVVFVIAGDPVADGYVASLARPGGRMTGLTSLNLDLDAKRLEMLKAALPGAMRVVVLATPHDRARDDRVAATERAARSLGVQLSIFDVRSADYISVVFDNASRARTGAVMLLGSPALELAARKRMPVISAWRELPDAGGFMSYGANVAAMFRQSAGYVDRILRGANPGELPVEQATKFDLIINLKTAKALGLAIPPTLLLRADHVIE